MKSILLGGSEPLKTQTQWAWWLLTWLPVAVMLAVILRESTEMFSSNGTSAWMRAGYQAVFGPVSDLRWPQIHHHIRKTGHFFGYGTLGLTWLRGWLLSWWGWLRSRAVGVWRAYSVAMAIFCTALVASLDELHQSFLPDRTGVPQDVLLDTSGAIVLIMIAATFWIRRPWESSSASSR